jgi:hypothetical protein
VLFTADDLGLPQNQESVTRCAARPDVVLESTNDYRAIADPANNFTGWHVSTDGGRSLANEGRLSQTVFPSGAAVQSDGNGVVASDDACNLYLASSAVDRMNPDSFDNGVVVARSTPDSLAHCPGGTDRACWPVRKVVVAAPDANEFIDKPWMAVGRSAGRTVVWVSYTEFFVDPDTSASGTRVKAVRCDAALTSCGAPVLVSGSDIGAHYSDLTVGPDGGAYVSWVDIADHDDFTQTFTIKLRAAPAGSTAFGPTQVVRVEENAIQVGGALHANTFRSVTIPKTEVRLIGGRPRAYVVWEACLARVRDGSVCEGAQVKLRYTDDAGSATARWSGIRTLSGRGNAYFPTISANPGGSALAVAWYTSRYDPTYDNRQDVELATVAADGTVARVQRLTPMSNAPEADPLLLGIYLGNYIEVTARDDQALVAFTASFRRIPFALDGGLPVPQQDNYLIAGSL